MRVLIDTYGAPVTRLGEFSMITDLAGSNGGSAECDGVPVTRSGESPMVTDMA